MKILLGFFAALALMAILLGWRLAIGPIALDWAGDYLKDALTSRQDNVTVDFRDAVLIWRKKDNQVNGRDSGLQVIFYDVEIIDGKTDFNLNIPEAGMSFSGLAMIRGLLAPTNVEIYGLSIGYSLDPEIWQSKDDRPFLEKLESFLENFQNSKSLPFEIAQELLSPPKSSAAAGYLARFSLLNTKITLTDQISGQIWQIPEAHLSLQRTEFGLNVRLLGNVNMAGSNIMPVDISLAFNNIGQEAAARISFSEFRPSALAGEVAALSGLSKLDIPARGDIEFTIDGSFKIPQIDFSLALGQGLVNPGNIYPEPLNITSAAITGYIQKNENSLILEEISLRLGQTYFSGSGMIYGSMDRPGIALKADITDLPFLDLKTYWPGQFGRGAYNWISKNIDGGLVPGGKLDVNISPDMWPNTQDQLQPRINSPEKFFLPADSVVFKFDFNNISAHYLRPMPILTNMSGQAVLNLKSFLLKASGGKIDQLTINKANLLFSDIHIKGGGVADITLDLQGTVEEILRVIDYKPLGYPSQYGIRQGSITGKANATVSLSFPLLKKVRLKDVIFDVNADIENLSIPDLTDTLAINDGKLHLFVDGEGIVAEGDITLNGVDFNTRWLEKFTRKEELPTRYIINGMIEGAQWEQLNLPFDPYIEGPVEIDLTLFGQGGNIKKGNGQFNLLNSKSIFNPVGWQKPRGKAGHVAFDLIFNGSESGESRMNIRNIILQSEDVLAHLELDMVGDRVTRFFIPKLVMPDTDIIMLMEWSGTKNYYLSTITGKAFNAAPLIEILMATGGDEEKVILPDFNLEAEINNLLTKNNVRLHDITLSAIYRDQDFDYVTFDGKISQDKDVKITVVPSGDNRKLEFESNDAGEALRGLGMFNIGVGGDMTLSADMVKHEHGISLGGSAKITEFKVIKSPEFSKLLDEKKFSKAKEELDKGSLSFSDFEMEFRTYNGVMEISKGRTRGPMLGMTIEGVVDQAYDELSISGTLIPAYGINSLLSNIPLIGTILTGGKGQGIFAATYTITGPLDSPKISINPLAALAPGILRNIFSAMGGKKKTLRQKAEEMQDIIPNTKSATELKKDGKSGK